MVTKATASKDQMPMNKLLKQDMNVAEAAQMLGLSRQTVYKLIGENALTVSRRKTATMGVFVSTESVIRYMRNVQLRQLPGTKRNAQM